MTPTVVAVETAERIGGANVVRRAATAGVPEAQFTVSIWYRDGSLSNKQDDKKAFEWAMKAAKQGHSQVFFGLIAWER